MSTSRRRFLTASAASAAALAGAAIHARAYAAPEAGWIELFDGKSLRGWHKNPMKIGHGTGGNWQVEDGVITGEQDPPGSGNGGILLTDRKFGDFELLIDLKPDWGICSGLFLRSTDRGQCLQMMVDYHDAGNVGEIYGEGLGGFNTRTFDINGKLDANMKLVGYTTDKHKTTADAGLATACTPEEWISAWKVNDWNTARVICAGKYAHITTWINGQKICEFDGTKSTAARYDKEKAAEQLGPEGSIAVQVHGGRNWPSGAKCRWKNIRVKPIS
jgi:3-keto-disaccharide hydrolase